MQWALFAAGWQKVMKKGKGFYALKSQIISENSPIIKGTWGHTSEWPLKNVSHQWCAFTVYCSWTVTEGQTFSFIYYPECRPAFLKTVFYIKKMQYTLIYVPCIEHYCRLVFKFQKTSCDESSVRVFVCLCVRMRVCMKCLARFDMSLSVPIAEAKPRSSGGPVASCLGRSRHASIQTQTLTQLWMPSGFCRPLRRGWALREMCKGVGGHWSRRGTE